MTQIVASVSALLIAIGLVLFGHGLQTTLLPLAAEQAEFSSLSIGLVSSAYFFGMVLGCLGSPHVIMRSGHIRAFAALVSLMSAAAILHPVSVDPVTWFIIRVISGFCLAGFYMIVESWLNEAATNETRGMIMSLYIVVLFAAMMVGQVSIALMDLNSFVPFAVASVLVSLAVIPVSLTRANQPAPITIVQFRPLKLYRNSPAALVGTLMIGVANGALLTLAPLYGSQIGMTTNQAAIYSAAVLGGGMVAQWPFGRLSDRMDRRKVLLGLSVTSCAVALGIALFGPEGAVFATVLAVVVGIFTQPTYAIAVSHAYDHCAPEDYVETSSGLLLSFGVGSVVGPLVASSMMQSLGPSGLYVLIAVIYLGLASFIVTRLVVRSPIAADEKVDFEYAATAQVGAVISPEPLDVDAPNVIPPEEFPAYENDIYNFDALNRSSEDDPTSPNEEQAGAEAPVAPGRTTDRQEG
ncbi:MFS transporter [Roseibium aestuarii]|uniref:MFS transporter n=1 Tax=Roseibium aestuarii TaxID=2600299 RepID=A0ABW4JUI0_9HYPH|nr:MFS transporter [Roseibium aestuarii]